MRLGGGPPAPPAADADWVGDPPTPRPDLSFALPSKKIIALRLSGIRQRLLRLLMVSQWSNTVRKRGARRGCAFVVAL